ncbi:MAG: hypothetical protein H6876_06170 [Hyphomicrobiaceae bacterium]|nr:hypothetical protein [Hyphomicrobiaceae bacterium]
MINSEARPSRAAKRRPAPQSIRLSPEQRIELARRAGDQPLGGYIKAVLFEDGWEHRASSARPALEREALGQALGMLGQSNLSGNLAALAEVARDGNLYTEPGTISQLERACEDIAAIRALLMEALGKRMASQPSAHDAFLAASTNWRIHR